MDGDFSGGDAFVGLSRRSAPHRRWRGSSRHRIGPLRTVAEAADHPVLSGIRSGALSGLIIVAVLGLPVFLILAARAPTPGAFEPQAKVWAAGTETDASVRVWAEPAPAAAALPVPVRAALVEPPRGRAGEERSPLSVDLIPVLDDASGALSLDEPAVAVAKPTRPSRAPTARRVSGTP